MHIIHTMYQPAFMVSTGLCKATHSSKYCGFYSLFLGFGISFIQISKAAEKSVTSDDFNFPEPRCNMVARQREISQAGMRCLFLYVDDTV